MPPHSRSIRIKRGIERGARVVRRFRVALLGGGKQKVRAVDSR